MRTDWRYLKPRETPVTVTITTHELPIVLRVVFYAVLPGNVMAFAGTCEVKSPS